MKSRLWRSGQVEVPESAVAGEKENERAIVVMFVDIVGCSEISNHKSLKEYNGFLAAFHLMFKQVTDGHRALWYEKNEGKYFQARWRGDEGSLMVFVPGRRPHDLARDVDTAVYIGLDLKRRWLLTDHNQERIKDGLLPTELGIGIHLGRVYVNDDNSNEPRAEGYAINLGKRIEGESRNGKFTRIVLSEAARESLELLGDEMTYTFDRPHTFQAEGILSEICVFEVEHHYLPTDWPETSREFSKSRSSRFEPTREQVEVVAMAYSHNPTNLWLAEECILLSMMLDRELGSTGGKNGREPYEGAERIAQRLITGEHRDAGSLAICGFVAGEKLDYATEQDYYKNAIDSDPLWPEAYWYLGESLSWGLFDTKGKRRSVDYQGLTDQEKSVVAKIVKNYEQAIHLNPHRSWFRYDLACELARWRKEEGDVERAIGELTHAFSLNPSIRDIIRAEPYLERVREDPRVKSILAGQAL